MKPSRLPKCYQIRREAIMQAVRRIAAASRAIGTAAAIAAVSAAIALAFVAPQIYKAGQHSTFSPAFDLARAELQAEMREACPCWFEDSRCKQPGAIVVCKMPEWMFTETGQ